MCSRHAEPGAGHPDSLPRPFRVHLRDIEGPAWWMTVTASSPDMARSVARTRAHDEGGEAVGVLKVEETLLGPRLGCAECGPGFYDDPNAEGER